LKPRRLDTWLLLAVCAAAFLYSFPNHHKLDNPNEKLRLYMTAALVEDGTFAVNTMRKRWGWVNDAAKRDGKFYSVKAPGTSYLGLPGYAAVYALAKAKGETVDLHVATWALRVTGSIVPMLIFLFFFHRFLRRAVKRAWVADVAFMSTALGSGLYAFTMLFASHATAGAAGFGALMLLLRAREREHIRRRHAFLAGLLVAGVTWFEYHGLIASLALSCFALLAIRPLVRLVPFAIGGLIPTTTMMLFQWRAYGSPFTPGHKMLENKALVRDHVEGFWGISEFHPEALGGLTFDPGHGLFPLTPLFLLAFPGFVLLARDKRWRAAAWTSITLIVLTWLLISTMGLWHGGWSVGPRYLTLAIPFVGWGAARGLDALAGWRPAAAWAVGLGCTATGLVATGIAGAYYPHIPGGIANPITDFFAVVIGHSYAPYNLLNLVGVYGTPSMAPLLLVAGAALFFAGWRFEGARLRATLGALLVLAVTMTPLVIPWRDTRENEIAHSLREWSPQGHDWAAVLEKQRKEEGDTVEMLEILIEVYAAERRNREVKFLKKRVAQMKKDESG
jgi:hypothetical protein